MKELQFQTLEDLNKRANNLLQQGHKIRWGEKILVNGEWRYRLLVFSAQERISDKVPRKTHFYPYSNTEIAKPGLHKFGSLTQLQRAWLSLHEQGDKVKPVHRDSKGGVYLKVISIPRSLEADQTPHQEQASELS